MKGCNQMVFNQATMCEIVQWYLNNELLMPSNEVDVSQVDQDKSNNTFRISLVEIKAEEDAGA